MAMESGSLAFLDNGLPSDITIKVGVNGTEMCAHRLILSASSSYFEVMLHPNSPFKEAQDGVVFLKVESSKIFRALLEYIYTGFYQAPLKGTLAFLANLFAAADYCGVERLREVVRLAFYAKLDAEKVDDLVEVIEVMYTNIPEAYYDLKDMVVDVVAASFEKLLESEKFQKAISELGVFSVDVLVAQSNMMKALKADFGSRSFYCRKCVNHGLPVFNAERVECKACHRASLVSPPQ
ncbi:BTB/POZ protein [Phyllosticta capitalensis]|uniref:BTB/POZ protein n=1 Tax=Phyllosticta capitalensis TaxID=121624 RepID=A0ABR1YJR6_9PEZI